MARLAPEEAELSPKEKLALAAIQALEKAEPAIATDARLVDENLVVESGVSRATLARSQAVMKKWREVKERSVRGAISALAQRKALDPSVKLEDRELCDLARVEMAAIVRLPGEVLQDWLNLKNHHAPAPVRRRHRSEPDEIIDTIGSKLFALHLALQQSEEKVETLTSIVARSGGNVVRLRPPPSGPKTD